MELNRIILIGNLTKDPETRHLPSGTSSVTKFRLAASRRYTSQGEKKEETLFIDVEAWGKTGEICAQYLRKGSQALVEGRLKMDRYKTQSGEERTVYVIVADNVQLGARPRDGQGGGDYEEGSGGRRQASGGYREDRPAPRAPEAREPRYDEADQSFPDDGPAGGDTQDDLPF
jgi:single-strand DNA-binding protein